MPPLNPLVTITIRYVYIEDFADTVSNLNDNQLNFFSMIFTIYTSQIKKK